MKRKVLIIGLDGATFDVIYPLIEEGWMPNFKNFIRSGASGSLLSTIPPISGPAWLTLATGIRPNKTGIYDFLYKKEKNYKLQSISYSDYIGKTVWDYLNQAGKYVGILNYPLLRPLYKINGFMTTGIGASPDSIFTYPKSLKRELDNLVNKYELVVPYHNIQYNNIDLFLEDLNRVFDKKVQATKYLIKEKKWDLFWVIFSETDWIQHIMWRYIDEEHTSHERNNNEKYKQAFKKFWNKIDREIGELSSIVDDRTNIFIISDHGFGSNDQLFKLNVWLEQEGYLVRKKRENKILNSIKGEIYSLLKEKAKKSNLAKKLFELYEWPKKVSSNLKLSVMDKIDLESSIAFDPGHTIPFGGIYINEQVVKTPKTKKKFIAEIAEKLKDWGYKNDVKVEIWHSNHPNAPDLLVGLNDWRCVVIKDLSKGKVFEQRPYSSRHTGSHRLNGIFIASGPNIRKSIKNQFHICDIAPTLLYLFDLPIPEDMDGKILKCIFDKEYTINHPPKFQNKIKTKKDEESIQMISNSSKNEEESIKKKLRDLGYM